MDLDPFVPVGIQEQTLRFLDIFLLHCLLSDSAADTPDEIAALGRNQHRVAARGREPGLRLERGGAEVTLVDWGAQVLDECRPIAAALDAAQDGGQHRAALAAGLAALGDAQTLASARVLASMRESYDNSYVRFARARCDDTKRALLALPLDPAVEATMKELARKSLAEQKRMEATDAMPFEAYRQHYLAPDSLFPRRGG